MEQPKHSLALSRPSESTFLSSLTLRRLQAVTRLSFLLRLASTALGK